MKDTKKLLIVRFSALGDLLLTTGIAKYIKNSINCELHLLTYKDFAEFATFSPYFDKVIPIDRKLPFKKYIDFLQEYLSEYDYIVDLQGKFRSKFLRFTTNAEYYSYKKFTFKRRLFVKYRLFKEQLKDHVVLRYFSPLKELTNTSPSIEELRPYLKIEEKIHKHYILIHPFASKQTKIWDKFPQLVIELNKRGVKPVIIGKGNFVCDGEYISKTGELSANELLQIIGGAKVLITTDSGPMHIAVALNTKVVAIFGSTTREFGFYPDFEGCEVLEKDIECRPCHVHGLDSCPKGDFRCMRDISVEDVLMKLDELSK